MSEAQYHCIPTTYDMLRFDEIMRCLDRLCLHVMNPKNIGHSDQVGQRLNDELHTISYTLTYSALSAPVLKSHTHFGKDHVAGGVMVFFCTNDPTDMPPLGTPACPNPSGTVTGTLTAGSVVGPVKLGSVKQNVPVGDFDAVVAALRSNTAYANVHSMTFPAGEIRGQIRRPDNTNR
jgi:hypothetical protein